MMESRYTTFYFERYLFDREARTIQFTYSLDRNISFCETLSLPDMPMQAVSEAMIDRVLFNLHLALGVSYWKTFCPPEMVIESGALTQEQATFWNTCYTKGLGEFFYKHTIDYRGLVHFPATARTADSAEPVAVRDRSLVLLGGGKDSLVTVELMKQMRKPFDLFSLNHYALIEQQTQQIDAAHLVVTRQMDPQLTALNKDGAYNGHVPISMIYSWVVVCAAVLYGYNAVIASNEHSANFGNVEYLGNTVNHQWSKSLEYETMLQTYMNSFVTPSITYFSLLRPLHEFVIAREFSKYPAWLSLFSSCNRNFIQQTAPDQPRWCGHCAKCLFVFTMLAPFVQKTTLSNSFGKNLFADAALIPLLEQLLDIRDVKPFDCVGTPEETRLALGMAQQSGAYAHDPLMMHVEKLQLPITVGALKQKIESTQNPHAIPDAFQSYLHEID